MAETIILTDDIDNTTGDVQRVHYTWAGVDYDVDLSAAHRAELEAALAPYLAASRKSRTKTTARRQGAGADKSRAVREWARANGHEVPAKGPIRADIMAAYEGAHQ